jgi:hypothetical protein
VGINARRDLANVTRPQEQAVAGDFGFSGIFPQRGDEDLTPTHEFNLSFLAVNPQLSAISLYVGSHADG